MIVDLLADETFTEKLPSDNAVRQTNFIICAWITVLLSGFIFMLLYWLWWKSKIKTLQTIPTSTCNKHLALAVVIVTTFIKNKQVDTNILFFQLLRGMAKVHQLQGLGLFYMLLGMRPVVVCFKANVLEAILKSGTNIQKSFDYSFLSLWLKGGLVTSKGTKWKHRRRTITAAFHYRMLEGFLSVFDSQSRVMVNRLKQALSEDWVDIVPYVTMCTLDVICETAMGIRIDAQVEKDISYVKSMHKVCEAFVSRVMRPWLWPSWVFFSTPQGKAFRRNAAAMDAFTRKVIQERKKQLLEDSNENGVDEFRSGKNQKALLDLLLELHLADPKNFTEADVQEEVDSFMFAGHDTTAVSTSWVLYLLGLYPEIQTKVQEEIDLVFGADDSRKITEDDIRGLNYLDCVIKETQRLYAPAPYIGRQLQEDVTVDGVTIPKGSTCMLLIYMLHRDENVFPNAEVFDPNRFLSSENQQRHPYAYCPFSAGPRSCIGQKFAILEEKVMLSNFLRHFSVRSIDERDQIQITAEMVLRSKNGIRLKIFPRK